MALYSYGRVPAPVKTMVLPSASRSSAVSSPNFLASVSASSYILVITY